MARVVKSLAGVCLLALLLPAFAVSAAEPGGGASVQVVPLQDDRQVPPAGGGAAVPEPRPPAAFGAESPSQGAGSAAAGRQPQDGTRQSGTVLAYLIELARRQNAPCRPGEQPGPPPPSLIFSEPLCDVAREAAADGADVAAGLAARNLRASRWQRLSAAEKSPQDAVARLRADQCDALMAPLTHIGAVYEHNRWWVVMASLEKPALSRNATVPAPAAASPPPPAPRNATVPAAPQGKEADALLALLNDVRAKGAICRGKALPPVGALKVNPRLVRAARRHAADMAEKKYFGMASPTGETLEKRVQAELYPWKVVTELIAKGPPPASAVLDLWLSSPNQCEQLMDSTLADAGIGYDNEYWAIVMGLEATPENLPPNDEPPGYGNGALKSGQSARPAGPAKPGPEPQRRK